MFTLSLRGIRAHLGRLFLTGLAIMLSVGFVAGTAILFPTMSKMIDGWIGQSVAGVDVLVRQQSLDAVGPEGGGQLTFDTVEELSGVAGVTATQPVMYETAALTAPSGKRVGAALAANWASEPFKVASLSAGSAPRQPTDLVLDLATVKAQGFSLGDLISVGLPGLSPQKYTLVGFAKFGEADSLGGDISAFLSEAGMRAVPSRDNVVDEVLIAGDGTETSLRNAVRQALPQGIEAITAAEYQAEQREGIAGQANIFQGIIGGFAAVSLLVGTFLIANTFSMIVAQRSREVALLRALGALRSQVKRMVLIEAAIIGFICSLMGLGMGVLVAKGLIGLLQSSTGMPKPPPLVIGPIVAVVGLLVGVGTTVAAAFLPIRRGTKIEPVAALRHDDVQLTAKTSKLRLAVGGLFLASGAGLGQRALSGSNFLLALSSSVLLLLGAVLTSPLLVRGFLSLMKLVLGHGVVGELAIDGARRSPKRTASTAGAMMIGLALVTGALGLVNSLKVSLGESLKRQYSTVDVVLNQAAFGDDVLAQIKAVPGVTDVGRKGWGALLVDGATESATAIDSGAATMINIESSAGATLDQLAADEVLVYSKRAKRDGITVGSILPVTYRKSGQQQLKVVGLFNNNATTTDFVISTSTLNKHFINPETAVILVSAAGSADEVRATIASAVEGRGAQVSTVATLIEQGNEQLNGLLGFVTGLMVLSMVIALLGIVNTTALSVLERTREIGMFRAIGMTRRQIRRVIRREAFAVSAFGTCLGIAVGVPISIILVKSMSGLGIDRVAIPGPAIALTAAVALLAGVFAALLPARRASRLDVLDAISH